MKPEETFITQSTELASSTLGNETIIMSTKDSSIFMLNSVGSAIWQAADGTTSLARIVSEKICAEFDIAAEQALADAIEFVEQMAQHGILQVTAKSTHRP
jgi:hypothetical protein